MTHILCIETSTDICSVCIASDEKVVAIRETERSFSHSEVITIFIEECLDEARLTAKDLSAVAVTTGPGSYTALRIGTSTAKGLCYALDIPLISVQTLKALAIGIKGHVNEGDLIIPMLDARRKEVYHAVYDASLQELTPVTPIVLDGQTFSERRSTIHFCGDGVIKARDILNYDRAVYHEVYSSAAFLVEEAFEKFGQKKFENIAYYTPYYLKPANINVQKKNILIQK